MRTDNLPRTIWFLWLQGIDKAPLVVQKCYASWLRHNPGWDVVLLDETTIKDYISLKPYAVTQQAYSDILRINLLAKYGGIWVDATCYCNKPLDEWLYDYMGSGFFAFERPFKDRMIASWFIASETNNYITLIYQKAVNQYWDNNQNLTSFETSRWLFLKRKFERRNPQLWFNPVVTKLLKVYPYFWFHYLFEKIYLKDKKVKKLWDKAPQISADVPHELFFKGYVTPIDEETREHIDNKVSPVYKLTWKYDLAAYKEGTILYYLLNSYIG